MRRYRNKKRKRIDGFFVACATPKETGLPYDILLDSLGIRKRFPGVPRVGVVVGDDVIPVRISGEPAILSGCGFPESDKVLNWVRDYQKDLLRHWNGEISDYDMLKIIAIH